jgi:hypothetical protein
MLIDECLDGWGRGPASALNLKREQRSRVRKGLRRPVAGERGEVAGTELLEHGSGPLVRHLAKLCGRQ